MRNAILFLLIILPFGCTNTSDKGFPVLRGDYLGQSLPGDSAVLFAPGIISGGIYERDIAVSPDGNEIYFSVMLGDWNTVMLAKRDKGVWNEPVVAGFARDTNYFFLEPALSADGNTIYFLSTVPRENEIAAPGWSNQNIWFAERQEDGSWGESTPLPQNINEFDEFYPSLTKEGTLYFTRTDKTSGVSSVLRSDFFNGAFSDPVALPPPVNGEGTIFNAFISPDDSYLVGCVAGRDTLNPGRATYMIFFHNEDDSWSEGVDLVKELGLPCPNAISISISPDGRFLFFASTVKRIALADLAPEWSMEKIYARRTTHGNGNSDIYWMRFDSIVASLRK